MSMIASKFPSPNPRLFPLMTSATQPRAQLQAAQLMPERRVTDVVPVAMSQVRRLAAVLTQSVGPLVQRHAHLPPITT